MNDILQQLLQVAPGIAAGVKGNGPGMAAFMESYQRTNAMLDEQERRNQEMQMRQSQMTAQTTRQTEQDRIAAEQRTQADALQRMQIPGQLAEVGGTAESPDDAKRLIESLMPNLMDAFGPETMALGQPAVEMATRTITGRQKRQMKEFVEKLVGTSFVADNPEADPEIANLPEHIVKSLGKPTAKLSELQQFAELPVGKPQGKTRIPAAAGSFEDYVEKKYGPNATADQILEARKVYQQVDDRAPRVTVNTGAADSRTNSRIDRIVNSFNTSPIVKEFNEVQAQHQTISQVVNNQWSGPGDMSVVFAFMKALDPNSVVRETEYANAAKSGNIFSGWAARFNGALNPNGGFLSDSVKRDFLRTIETRMGVKRAQYDNLRKQTVQKIDRIRAGAPETGDEAVTDYGAAFPNASQPDATTKPTFAVGQKVRNKKTGEIREVTGVRPDGSPILGVVKQ